jgi:hypothetical protein
MRKKVEPKITVKGTKVTVTFDLTQVGASFARKFGKPVYKYKTPLGKFETLKAAAEAEGVAQATIVYRIKTGMHGYSKIEPKAIKSLNHENAR